MKRCIDTSVLSEIIRGSPKAIGDAERWLMAGDELLTTAVAAYEVALGIERESSPAKRAALREIWGQFEGRIPSLPLDKEAADIAAVRQADLFRRGRPAPLQDLLIAAIAASNGCDLLVTRDREDFARIGLVKVGDL